MADTDVDIDFDPSSVRVNFSDQEAASEARDITPVPTGKYTVRISDIETRFSNSEKNKGKPYWSVEMTCTEGKYEGRKFWGNVMLFDGALYSLGQLMKAIGREDVVQTGEVPTPDEVIGEEIVITVAKQRNKYAEEQAGDGEAIFKNEVKGYMSLSAVSTKGGSGGGSLMP